MSQYKNVVMCVDRGFSIPLAVSLASLDSTNKGSDVRVHVLHPGIPDSLQRRVALSAPSTVINWIFVDEKILSGAYFSDFLSTASLLRLIMARVLPSSIERVLYIDADTVVREPIDELFSMDLGDSAVGAVRDALAPWAASPWGADWRGLGMNPSSPYFNSGVLLVDLNKWRTADVGEQALALLRRQRPEWGDQDALNKTLEGVWTELSRRWNVQTGDFTGHSPAWALWQDEIEAATASPYVIHYTGREKPWNFGSDHPCSDEWYRWLDRTEWSGWRPSLPKSSALESLGRNILGRYRARRDRALNSNTELHGV